MSALDEAVGTRVAADRLGSIVGREKAELLIAECLNEAGLLKAETPDEIFQFAQAMIKRGGIAEVVGRSLRLQAILQGAAFDQSKLD